MAPIGAILFYYHTMANIIKEIAGSHHLKATVVAFAIYLLGGLVFKKVVPSLTTVIPAVILIGISSFVVSHYLFSLFDIKYYIKDFLIGSTSYLLYVFLASFFKLVEGSILWKDEGMNSLILGGLTIASSYIITSLNIGEKYG